MILPLVYWRPGPGTPPSRGREGIEEGIKKLIVCQDHNDKQRDKVSGSGSDS